MVRRAAADNVRLPLPSFSPSEVTKIGDCLRLSPRQREIVALLLQGQKDKQIARAMGLTVRTVREHLSRVFERTGATDRLELVLQRVAMLRNERMPAELS